MVSVPTFLKTAIFTLLVPGTVAVAIPQVLARIRPHPTIQLDPQIARRVGTISILGGVALYLHTAVRFGTEGGGTPSPTDEPEELVTGGVYAYSRNPMYVGVLLVILGQAIRQRSLAIGWWGLGAWIGFHNRVIRYEEPHLAEKHGESFEEYRERVPRWVPGRSSVGEESNRERRRPRHDPTSDRL